MLEMIRRLQALLDSMPLSSAQVPAVAGCHDLLLAMEDRSRSIRTAQDMGLTELIDSLWERV